MSGAQQKYNIWTCISVRPRPAPRFYVVMCFPTPAITFRFVHMLLETPLPIDFQQIHMSPSMFIFLLGLVWQWHRSWWPGCFSCNCLPLLLLLLLYLNVYNVNASQILFLHTFGMNIFNRSDAPTYNKTLTEKKRIGFLSKIDLFFDNSAPPPARVPFCDFAII